MIMRLFDSCKDDMYGLNGTPDLYLSEEQVSSALKKITVSKEKGEEDALKFVIHIETLHRQEAQGTISHNALLSEIKQEQESFVKKYGFWPYAAKTYKAFYEQFNKE